MFNKNLMVALKNSFRGFTLVEMLLALAISSIVLAAIYSVFTIANKNFTTQNVAANVQQNLRSAIGLMARDIRLAGLDPAGSDNFGIEYASEKTIRLTMDSIDSEEITYEFKDDLDPKRVVQTLYETASSPNAAVLISNIEELKFAYFDATNTNLIDTSLSPPQVPDDKLADIRTVEILVTHQEPAGRDKMVSRTLTRRVECRNLAFN
jgi:prepilin-type N-terminal cleavage/methylation domain-containing protein